MRRTWLADVVAATLGVLCCGCRCCCGCRGYYGCRGRRAVVGSGIGIGAAGMWYLWYVFVLSVRFALCLVRRRARPKRNLQLVGLDEAIISGGLCYGHRARPASSVDLV